MSGAHQQPGRAERPSSGHHRVHLLARKTTRLLLLMVAASVSVFSRAQLCTTAHTTDLYCLLPSTFHTSAAPFNALFTPFGTELSELPTARPGGLVLTFEHGVLVPADESLGAVFTERAESLGRHRIFVGFTYQNFTFNTLDGLHLNQVPIVLFYSPLQVYTATQSRFDVRVGQYTAVAAAGITDRIDVSVAVPFERVSFATTINGNEYGLGGASANVSEHVPGTASGIADVVLGGKALLLDRENTRLTGGVDLRLPTGDELNFLGSGTVGVRPYLALAHHGRISPHLNVGYQWNGNSILNATSTGVKQELPGDFFYTAGANFAARKGLTLTADMLGRHFFDAPRLSNPTAVTIPSVGSAMSVEPYTGSFTTADLSLGFKAQTFAHLLITGNVTLKLNNGGLRAQAVPLGGISYSF